jgi:hypothetical protein
MVFLQTIEHSLGETSMDEHEEFDHLSDKQCHVRAQLWERRIFEARRLADEQMTLEDLAAEFGCHASASARSRGAPSKRCSRR